MFKRTNDDHAESTQTRLETPVPDYIPYACHYDRNTLLTKNGELIQFIKITGFSYESIGSERASLRETIRKTIAKNIQTNDIAFWFHTMRRRTNLELGAQYERYFSSTLNRAWNLRHGWGKQYMNELYISVIHDGQSVRIHSAGKLMNNLFSFSMVHSHDRYLDRAFAVLDSTVNRMLDSLKEFGARRLSLRTKEGVYYSEPLELIGKIINLAEMEIPLPVVDYSTFLASHKIAFGSNNFEVLGKAGKHFGAVFSIKEYPEMTDRVIDKLLQLPQRFVISQAAHFMPGKAAKESVKEQYDIMKMGNDEELINASSVKEFIEASDDSLLSFFSQQTTITFLAESTQKLEREVETATRALHQIGLNVVREDLCLEDCYWSQLPANFNFLKRLTPLPAKRIGGLASLYNFPAGKKYGNHWGNAVTVFHTKDKTPYFFNFHHEDNGHTAVIGPYGTGKTALLNFLVSQALKFKPRLFYLDYKAHSHIFIQAINGQYHSIAAKGHRLFNPLALENTNENKQFLAEWVSYMCYDTSKPDLHLSETDTAHVTQAIESLYNAASTSSDRTLAALGEIFAQQGASHLRDNLAFWHGDSQLAYLFDNQEDLFSANATVTGIDITLLTEHAFLIAPVLSYLMHRIALSLDGTPTIVVLDEAWKLVDNRHFVPKLKSWMDRLREHNAMVIFATESVEDASKSKISQALFEHITTEIYLPDPKADSNAYQRVFGLTDREFSELQHLDIEQREFLLKHHRESVVATLDLKGLEELSVLSCDPGKVAIMNRLLQAVGDKPEEWLPRLFMEVDS